MATQEPLRGSDAVNGELEVGYNEHFKSRWYATQIVGLACMVVFLSACAAGLLGRGIFSHQSIASADGSLRVDYEPVARESTGTQVTFHVSNMQDKAVPVVIYLSGHAAEPLGLDHTLPATQSAVVGDRGILFRFMIGPRQKNSRIRFDMMPTAFGLAHVRAWRVADPDLADSLDTTPDPAATVEWSQLIMP
ncbi:MAG: hypothetical protein ACRYGI_04165 [Janthinobacterium lividum]